MNMTDIHDIRPPVILGIDPLWKTYALYALAGVLVLAAGVWGYRMWRKWRDRDLEIETLFPEPAPEDWARQKLDDLKPLMDLRARDYYFGLSEVFRGYLERRFGIKAPEMTSEELLPKLPGLGLSNELIREAKALLNFSDGVKFAGLGAPKPMMETHDQWVRAFVKQTTPDLPEGLLPAGAESSMAVAPLDARSA